MATSKKAVKKRSAAKKASSKKTIRRSVAGARVNNAAGVTGCNNTVKVEANINEKLAAGADTLTNLMVFSFGPPKPKFKLSVTIVGMPGSFEYEVDSYDQAMQHFAAITTTGYRRENDRKQLQWFAPSQIASVKIAGPGIGQESNYTDSFKRT